MEERREPFVTESLPALDLEGVESEPLGWVSESFSLLSSGQSRVNRLRIDVMRSSLAVIASSDVGQRRGSDRMFNIGSRSVEGGEVGVWKVSPFFRLILHDSADSVVRDGRSAFKTGRRRGCTRAESTLVVDMMG